jgi:ABC-type nitrate/sulfonate/bicarbonate transport system permease component
VTGIDTGKRRDGVDVHPCISCRQFFVAASAAGLVAGMLAANEGLGHLIWHGRTQLSPELIFVGVLTLGIIALGSDAAFERLLRAVAWGCQP